MLKKVVKYGNSNAVILDKAILELLNIAEGSTLKIKTDGVSLILTPLESSSSSRPSITGEECLMNIVHDGARKLNDHAGILNEKLKSDSALLKQMQQEVNALNEKYAHDIKLAETGTPEFYQELEALKEVYEKNGDKKEYMQAFLELRKKHFPQLTAWDEQMKAIEKRYAQKMKS